MELSRFPWTVRGLDHAGYPQAGAGGASFARGRLWVKGGVAGVAVAVSGSAAARAIYAVVDETAGRHLRIVRRRDGVITELGSAPIADHVTKPFMLEVTAFDDRVRAQAGEAVVESSEERRDLRTGRVALVAQDGGRFSSLTVEALDAWRGHFVSSRYDDFPVHVGSFEGTVGAIEDGAAGAPAMTVASLLTRDSARIGELMTPHADVEARERLFADWVATLALPLRQEPGALSLTRLVSGNATNLIVIESAEPLPFSRDVSLALRRRMVKFPHFDHVAGRGGGVIAPRFALRLNGDARARGEDTGARDIKLFLANLEFEGDVLTAPLIPVALADLRSIVRAEAVRRGVEYHVYTLTPGSRGSVTTARRRRVLSGADLPRGFEAIAPGEIGVFDGRGRPLLPPFPLPPVPAWVTVLTRVLTSGDERRALIIPLGGSFTSHAPLGAGTYRFSFSIDRARWRTETPDDTSNYRASKTLAVSW